MNRCEWAQTEMMTAYHDQEWGVPLHDDRLLFEFLILEGAQAGLSWSTILQRRETYRLAFDKFDPLLVAGYSPARVETLLLDAGIIRNRRKIEAAVQNARVFLQIQREFGTFDAFLWSFVGDKPVQNRWQSIHELPASTPTSEVLSRDLKKRGMQFVGPTICYAYMQAVGLVNDHTISCFRYQELSPE
jgi:DNA-3-methyladenine glycosylase I